MPVGGAEDCADVGAVAAATMAAALVPVEPRPSEAEDIEWVAYTIQINT